MKQLRNTKTVEKASTADIEKYIVPAYLETFTIEKTAPDFSREDDRISNKRLYFNIHENELTDRRVNILDGFLEQIADSLNLENNESVNYGEIYNANGIGNNVRLPIIVNTPEKEIQFGYLNANHDIFCNIKHFRLTDNNDEPVDAPTYELHANKMWERSNHYD